MNTSAELDGYAYRDDIWPHQEAELLQHSDEPRRGLFWAMRTGKTRPVLEYSGWLHHTGRIDLTIVVCSKIAVTENVWGRQAEEHLVNPPAVFSWDSLRMRSAKHHAAFHEWYRSGVPGGRLLVINREAAMTGRGIKVLEQLTHKHPNRLMVSDEHHTLRNNSKTHKQLLKWFTGAPYVRVITGTPLGNRPSALYWQTQFLHPKPFGCRTQQEFLAGHAHLRLIRVGGRHIQTENGYRDRDRTLTLMRGYGSVIRRDECPWLPALRTEWVDVPLAKPAREQMDRLIEDGEYGAPLRIRARQLCSGFLMEDKVAETPQWEMEGVPPKTERAMHLINQTDEKVIVYCAFRLEAQRLYDLIQSRRGHPDSPRAVLLLGGTSAPTAARTLDTFRHDPSTRVLVATAQCLQDSIDLSCAGMVIWHSLIEESTVFEQASARHAGGGTPVVCIALATTGTVEKTIAYALRNNLDLYSILQTHEYQKVLAGTVQTSA